MFDINSELQSLKQLLADVPGSVTTTFVVPHTWPDIKNAEFEVLQRLATAASNIGAVMVVTDNNGYPLWSNDDRALDKNRPIDVKIVDFMISLHFESPRLIDVYSYYALWQPLSFYSVFGYEETVEKVLSHTDALSCRADLADAHATNLMAGVRVAPQRRFPPLFHSPPAPYFAPAISSESRLFYVGINWERINSERGRHQDLLERLDQEKLIDIYGPRKFLGVEPWRGFDCYRGELAFDGQSVVKALHRSGICLALSSDAHQRSALMSNRLFEGLAAGAAIIANRNAFIDRYFSDLVYMIDDRSVGDDLYFQVKDIIDEIRRDPAAANARALEGQRRLGEMFSLERCLASIASGHETRRKDFEQQFLSQASVAVLLVYTGESAEEIRRCLDDIAGQRQVSTSAILICDESIAEHHRAALEDEFAPRLAGFRVVTGRYRRDSRRQVEIEGTGKRIREALGSIDADYFAFMREDEHWFRDHLATMAKVLDVCPDASLCMAGTLDEETGFAEGQSRVSRKLDVVRSRASVSDIVGGEYTADAGRFLFRRSVAAKMPTVCLDLLDGTEPGLAQMVGALNGRIADSGFASYVRSKERRALRPAPLVGLDDQIRYIADALAGDAGWIEAKASLARARSQLTLGSSLASDRVPALPIGEELTFGKGEHGTSYLGSGFSYLEPEFVWIDGERGSLTFELTNPGQIDYTDLDLMLRLRGREKAGRLQHCTVVVNGVSVAYLAVPASPTPFTIRIPRKLLARPIVNLELIADHAEFVVGEGGQVMDKRKLGLCLHGLAWLPSPATAWHEAALGHSYATIAGGDGERYLGAGFYRSESLFTWMAAQEARLSFIVNRRHEPLRLSLVLGGYPSKTSGEAQQMSVVCNGHVLSVLDIQGEPAEYSVDISEEFIPPSGRCVISLVPKGWSAVFDEDGNVVDPRLLSGSLSSFRISARGNADTVLGAAVGRHGQLMAGDKSLGDSLRFPGSLAGRRGVALLRRWFGEGES